jgi:hypothetical protein
MGIRVVTSLAEPARTPRRYAPGQGSAPKQQFPLFRNFLKTYTVFLNIQFTMTNAAYPATLISHVSCAR